MKGGEEVGATDLSFGDSPAVAFVHGVKDSGDDGYCVLILKLGVIGKKLQALQCDMHNTIMILDDFGDSEKHAKCNTRTYRMILQQFFNVRVKFILPDITFMRILEQSKESFTQVIMFHFLLPKFFQHGE